VLALLPSSAAAAAASSSSSLNPPRAAPLSLAFAHLRWRSLMTLSLMDHGSSSSIDPFAFILFLFLISLLSSQVFDSCVPRIR